MTYPTNIDTEDLPLQLRKDDAAIIYMKDKIYDIACKFKDPLEEDEVPNPTLTYSEIKTEVDDYISKGWELANK